MFVVAKYSAAQFRTASQHKDLRFEDFIHQLAEEADDFSFFRYVDALLNKIYLLSRDGKFMTKTGACRMIPAKNAATCIKYVDEAERRNFISFERDEKDKRKIIIRPSIELINYVEQKLSSSIDEMRELIADIGSHGFPADNIALSNQVLKED